jgi:hypothetical protein
MKTNRLPTAHWSDGLVGLYLRVAASGVIPARWYLSSLPPLDQRAAATGDLKIEIVSHCWNYSHMLVRQLSSLVLFPPARAAVTMTVFYSEEDTATVRLLETFASKEIPGVTWNWCALPKEQLFRRSIGRNQAALRTDADWVWFTDGMHWSTRARNGSRRYCRARTRY